MNMIGTIASAAYSTVTAPFNFAANKVNQGLGLKKDSLIGSSITAATLAIALPVIGSVGKSVYLNGNNLAAIQEGFKGDMSIAREFAVNLPANISTTAGNVKSYVSNLLQKAPTSQEVQDAFIFAKDHAVGLGATISKEFAALGTTVSTGLGDLKNLGDTALTSVKQIASDVAAIASDRFTTLSTAVSTGFTDMKGSLQQIGADVAAIKEHLLKNK